MSNKFVFDGDEMRVMRENIPSLRRKNQCISQVDAAEFLGVSRRTITNWETRGAGMLEKLAYDGLRDFIRRKTMSDAEDLAEDYSALQEELNRLDEMRASILRRIGLPTDGLRAVATHEHMQKGEE